MHPSDSECEDDFTFDLAVAGRHTYLGDHGEEHNRKIIYPKNTILTVPILEEISTIILPGTTQSKLLNSEHYLLANVGFSIESRIFS